MTQLTSGQIYETLSSLPFGSAVLCNVGGERQVAVLYRKTEEMTHVATERDQWYFWDGSTYREDITPISAIKPEGFCFMLGHKSPFTIEGYDSLFGVIQRSRLDFLGCIVTFHPPESPAQKNLREAEEKLAEAQEAVKKAREGMK